MKLLKLLQHRPAEPPPAEEIIGRLEYVKPWACPTCGGTHYFTRATAHRADGTTIRLRQCERCGAWRSTEERVIGEGKSPFYGNAESRREWQRKREHQRRGRVTCRYCGETYQSGSFGMHVRRSTNPVHANRNPKKRDYNRAYQRRKRQERYTAALVQSTRDAREPDRRNA